MNDDEWLQLAAQCLLGVLLLYLLILAIAGVNLAWEFLP